MKYDFTTIMDRHGQDAMAVDALGTPGVPGAPKEGFDAIPMWVADMNFPVCPSIIEAISARLAQPHFGYFYDRPEYFDAIISWHEKRNGVSGLERKHIGYENGVLGGLVSTLQAFARPGDTVLVHSPTYIGFTSSIENAGYRIELSPLIRDEQGVWRMDYEDMARRLREHHIHVAVFCSPHNPLGRVWQREEIEKAMEVYAAHDCVVISDEIWSDIILPGHKHVPTQSVSEDARRRTVALYAPSKTFNLAGLVGSYHIIYDDYLRERVLSASSKAHYNEMNVLSMHALMGAYTSEGMQWVDELIEVLGDNVDWAYKHITENYKGIHVDKPEGTYMLFLDCSEWCAQNNTTLDDLLRAGWDVGVAWQDGRPFHGPCHIRVNLALPHARVQEAFGRLDRYVFSVA
ncbi:MalY/PatB family protein [Olsenella sp. Marseille-QA0557]|uniref:cysteine-S-conjugate beta-lyase n=1 Tax=Candidatus Coprovicinus avistercoris TaxID=2840754 RepID=A0A9D1HZX5_9ACTN|nr:aminotransferase class I/II-fold pyridoxal phosphate-dependent enzyme [Candidatus Coprovicinus avistercoris]